jgi:F-type H+-transporting ATPase subunit b
MRTRQQTVMQENAIALADQLKRLAAAEVFDIARKVLTDLASADLEERLGGVFARLLRQLNPTLKASLGAVIKAPNAAPIVRSRFGLSTPLQASIRSAFKETFASDVVLSFESAPDSLCGIELTVGGQRLSWDIAQYLKVLEQRVEALLSAEAKRASAIPVQKPPPAGVALLPSPIVGPTVPAPTGVAHAIASG